MTEDGREMEFEIIKVIFRIDRHRKVNVERIEKKRYFLIIISTILIIISVLSILEIISVFESSPINGIEYYIIFVAASIIVMSLWVLSHKFSYTGIPKYNEENIEEILKGLEDYEEELIYRSTKQFAWTLYMIAILSLSVAYYIYIHYDSVVTALVKPEYFTFLIILLALIGDLIGRPQHQKAYLRSSKKLVYKIEYSYLTNLDNSFLNPHR